MDAPELLHHLRDAGLVLTLTPADGLHVAPRKALTEDLRVAIRAQRDALVLALLSAHADLAGPQSEQRRGSSQDSQDSQGHPGTKTIASCTGCLHLLPHGTCGEPVAAGLAQNFAIAWPPAGYGASCAAFTPKPAPEAAGRAYALTKAQGDVAHAEAWDDAACALFVVRTARIQRRGFSESDATDLAEQLHLRDVRADYRHACLECKHLAGAVSTGWRCGNHKAAGLNAAQVAADLVVMQQYCQGFADEGGGYA